MQLTYHALQNDLPHHPYHNLNSLIKFFKYFEQKFCILTKHSYLCSPKIMRESQIEIWCNGSTTDSGSVSEGSSPSISTKY